MTHPFELVNRTVRRGPFRAVIFDFDGTLSLIREGWPRVMVEQMMAHLRSQRLVREPEAACAAHVERFVMALNGHPTLRQMERFAEEVSARGGSPAPPGIYLQEYLESLMSIVRGRWDALASGSARPEEWVVSGAHDFLRGLHAARIPLLVASGTDLAHVQHEVELLQLAPSVGGRVHAPKDNDPNFRKRAVIERVVHELGIRGEQLLAFGDGVVETEEVKRIGGVAVGVASSEAGVRGVNAAKRDLLIAAGADIIIADYQHAGELLEWLQAIE